MIQTSCLENIPFNDIAIGQKASLTRTLTQKDIALFAAVSGDINPEHLDENYAKHDMFHGIIGHGMWAGALISAVLGTQLPGPGTIYLEQTMQFKKPVRIGDSIKATATVITKKTGKSIVTLECLCQNQHGETVVQGIATVMALNEKIRLPKPAIPQVEIKNETPV